MLRGWRCKLQITAALTFGKKYTGIARCFLVMIPAETQSLLLTEPPIFKNFLGAVS